MKELFFISKDARWQKYRNDVLTALASKHGYKITILTNGPVGAYLADSSFLEYKIFRSWLPDSWQISFFPGALIYIIRNKPACVLAVLNFSQLTEYIALILCKIFGIRFVFWTHGYDHGKRPHGRMLKLFDTIRVKYMESCLRLADSIITFSEKGKEYLVLKKIKNESEIFCAPNTLDTNRLNAISNEVKKNKENLRADLEIPLDHFVILFSGRIYQDKRLMHALEAFEIVRVSESKVTFVIIGDGAEKPNLQSFVDQKQLKNVCFKNNIFRDEESSKWFLASDVFLIPGAVGLAIVHAFTFGLPIITEECRTHGPEIQFLKNGVNGFIVKENSIAQIADKLLLLINNRFVLQAMSVNAAATARKDASIDTMIDVMNEAIK